MLGAMCASNEYTITMSQLDNGLGIKSLMIMQNLIWGLMRSLQFFFFLLCRECYRDILRVRQSVWKHNSTRTSTRCDSNQLSRMESFHNIN